MNGVIEFRQDENGENFPSENTMDRLEYRLSSIEDMEKEEIQKYINHGDLVRFKEGIYQVAFVNTYDLCSYELQFTPLKM